MVAVAQLGNGGGEEEIRKGPWTEQEDVQLVLCVNVYGDRRWDFVAKVSGLKRTGKSCRLRWVNYLHPGLKRGKMTPHEERLVLELHSKWGNRWSRIARKLPGRTDNEIKNYWRTHMRKKAQERKKGGSVAASSSATSSSSSSSGFSKSSSSSDVSYGNSPAPVTEKKDRSFYDTGGVDARQGKAEEPEKSKSKTSPEKVVSSTVDEIWKDMDFFGDDPIKPVYNDYGYGAGAGAGGEGGGGGEGGCNFPCQSVASPMWDYFPVSLWNMDDEEESKKFPPINDQFYSFYNNQENAMSNTAFLTG